MGTHSRCPNCNNTESGTTVWKCDKCGKVACGVCCEVRTFSHDNCPRCDSPFSTAIGEIGRDGNDDDDGDDSSPSPDSTTATVDISNLAGVVDALRQEGFTVTHTDDTWVLYAASNAGKKRTFYVRKAGDSFEFFVPSRFGFQAESDIPQALAVLALKKSAGLSTHYWCVRKVGQALTLVVMHNRFGPRLTPSWITKVTSWMLETCDKLEREFE